MIVGENSRADDMDVKITTAMQQTNIRSSTADNFDKLIPPWRVDEDIDFEPGICILHILVRRLARPRDPHLRGLGHQRLASRLG